ncbi:50S ribosomal protein L32 [Clostridia bacterium]|nr:50S ribosomal protein L32 [Clostridia bacterium]
MAVPKCRVSRTRRDKRRSNVWKLKPIAFSRCDNCGELKVPHRVCPICGHYKGREVIATGND